MSELLARPSIKYRPTTTPVRAVPPRSTDESGGQPRAHPSRPRVNPVRIGRIGADQIQVFIPSVLDDAELLAVAERLERLLVAGYETIDVVFEEAAHPTR